MEQGFPIATFLEVKHALLAAQQALEIEKSAWAGIRHTLQQDVALKLDDAFRTTFEQIDRNYSLAHLQSILQTLEILVQQGASGRTMSTHELEHYNLAMLVEDLRHIKDKEHLEVAARIIKLTIIADAAVNLQKAYVGNGGMPALDFVCLYLAHGIDTSWYKLSALQYECLYQLFPLLSRSYPKTLAQHSEYDEPYHMYMRCLQDSPAATDLQVKTYLRMICLGWTPFSITEEWMGTSLFSKIAFHHPEWLALIFPYEHEQLKFYVDIAQQNITPATIKIILNTITSNNKSRKDFKTFFSQRPHWFIKLIITTAPDAIFNLVKRNEKDLLAPFLRHYKRELAALRNDEGLTLGAYAATAREIMANTIQLLREANITAETRG